MRKCIAYFTCVRRISPKLLVILFIGSSLVSRLSSLVSPINYFSALCVDDEEVIEDAILIITYQALPLISQWRIWRMSWSQSLQGPDWDLWLIMSGCSKSRFHAHIEEFHVDDAYKQKGASDASSLALRQFLHHPAIQNKVSIVAYVLSATEGQGMDPGIRQAWKAHSNNRDEIHICLSAVKRTPLGSENKRHGSQSFVAFTYWMRMPFWEMVFSKILPALLWIIRTRIS